MTQESFSILESAIADAIPDLPEGCLREDGDLLLYNWKSDIAGFTLTNGEPEQQFATAYAHFKGLYREHKLQWDDASISFVLLRSDEDAEQDGFFAEIESDPYFCRKYVLRYHRDSNVLIQEVARLPFLPLPRIEVTAVSRPVSAKQLLVSSGVPAELSRELIEPGRRSENSFLEAIRDSGLDIPTIEVVDASESRPEFAEAAQAIRVNSIRLDSFRAYRDEQTFDLGAPVTVLYGQNGLGKTSVFDAVDFACTGRIGRLSRVRRTVEEFAELATHLDKGAAQAEVTLDFEVSEGGENNSYRSRRSVAESNWSWIENKRFDRKQLLTLLTGATTNTSLSITHLESLFRATHLFGQDDQELLLGFRNSSFISNDLFSRMIALEDYTAGISKVEKLEKTISKWVNDEKESGERLETEVAQRKEELRSLEKKQELSEDFQPSTVIWSDASKAAKQILQIEVGEHPTDDVLAELVAITTAHLDAIRGEATELDGIAAKLYSHAKDAKSLEKAEDRLKQLISEHAGLVALASAAELAKKRFLEQRTKDEGRRRSTEDDLQLANHAKKMSSELRGLETDIARSEERLEELRKKRESQKPLVQQLVKDIENLDERLLKVRNDESAIQERLTELNNATKSLAELSELQSKQKSRTEHVDALSKSLRNSEAELTLILQEHDELKRNVTALSNTHKVASGKSSELTKLLDELEQYVQDDACPACGSAFGDTNDVRNAIRSRKQERSVEAERVFDELVAKRSEFQKCIGRRDEAKESVDGLSTRIRGFEKDANNDEQRVNEISRSLAATNVPSEVEAGREAIQSAKDSANELLNRHRSEISKLSGQLSQAKQELELRKKTLAELDSLLQSETTSNESFRSARLALTGKLADSMSALELEDPADQDAIANLAAKLGAKLARIVNDSETVANEGKRLDDDLASANSKIADAGESRKRTENEVSESRARVRLLQDSCSRLRISFPPTPESVKTARADADDAIKATQKLLLDLKQVSNAMHAESSISRLKEVRAQVGKLENDLATQEATITRAASNQKAIRQMSSVLLTYRGNAISSHIDRYGPFISILQKRLRSVFGFQELHLRSAENGVVIEASWRDRLVKPVDYFSDSQKQILMLSVFLGSCLRQNWSGFSPIMLDDPVTHFDDLNAHAFVELIRGLVATEPDRWQFVISTCEDRLYSLMRKKFSSGAMQANFYHFKGMTEAGPIVEKE